MPVITRHLPSSKLSGCGVPSSQNQQYLLWIDAVGGYLVCPQVSVAIGQAVPGTQVDVPVLGDVSRLHATIQRLGDSYLLTPYGKTFVGQHRAQEAVPLRDGDEITFNERVHMRFRLPHPLSNSACLEMTSRHRTEPAVHSVVLMADSCVLGPSAHSHVVCRPWTSEIVLARHSDGLRCRAPGDYWIDGQLVRGLNPLTNSSLVQGEGFSWRLESWCRTLVT